jgi:hypothetical protein
MTVRSSLVFTLTCAFGITIALPGWAQAEAPVAGTEETYSVRAAASENESYGVVFEDDPMFALGPDTLIPRLTVRKGVPMAGLLRPRASFVPELLKSVESF